MVMTKRGIYHNLQESEYTVSNNDTVLFFSSRFYQNKFMIEHKSERGKFKRQHKVLTREFQSSINLLSDLYFYKILEKRGFYIEYKGESLTWQEIVISVLLKKIEPSIKGWLKTPEQR